MSQLKVDSVVPRGGLASGTQGGIIQMKYTSVNSVVSVSCVESGTHISSFDTAITPLFTTSRIIIQCFFGRVSSSSGNSLSWEIKRNDTRIDDLVGDSEGNRKRFTMAGASTWNADQNHCHSYMLNVMDAPATTSSVTYKLYGAVEGGTRTMYFNRNRANANANNVYSGRGMSSMLVMEVNGL
tara:strand:- start:274 stop:822 length:549 start_codon:yes stop_codon:yes gene_type:complete